MKRFFTILLTLSVFLISIIGNAFADEFQLRNGIIFGDTLETIKQKETLPFKSITDDNTSAWFGNGKISGIDGQVRFDFSEDAGILTDMLYAFDITDNKDILDNDYSKLKNGLIRKYGDPLGNVGGSAHIITGQAFNYSGMIIALYREVLNGGGDFRDYDEWIIHCDEYNVKIDLVSYYYRNRNYEYSYENLISYHYYKDDDLLDAIQQQQEENDAIDNDL